MNDFWYHYDDKVGPDWNEPGPGFTQAVLEKPADWNMTYLFAPNATKSTSMPTTLVQGSWGGASWGEGLNTYPYNGLEWNQEYGDNLAITLGSHNLKMGVTVNRGGTHNTAIGYGLDQGQITFTTSGSTVTTGNAMADMLLGRAASYLEGSAAVNGTPIGGYFGDHWYFKNLEPYFQDDWRVTHRLTLNMGARFFYLWPWDDQSAAFNLKWHGVSTKNSSSFAPQLFNPAVQAPLNAAGYITPNAATGQIYNFTMYGNGIVQCGQSGIPKDCQYNAGFHVAPRFGFAYQPFNNPNTVIRGGYGIFYDQMTNDSNPKDLRGNNPVFLSSTAANVIGWDLAIPGPLGRGPRR